MGNLIEFELRPIWEDGNVYKRRYIVENLQINEDIVDEYILSINRKYCTVDVSACSIIVKTVDEYEYTIFMIKNGCELLAKDLENVEKLLCDIKYEISNIYNIDFNHQKDKEEWLSQDVKHLEI